MYIYRISKQLPNIFEQPVPLHEALPRPNCNHMACYLAMFKLRNPVLYYLWYRHRAMFMWSKDERKKVRQRLRQLARMARVTESPRIMRRSDEFALYHPFLFLFFDAFQLLKISLTAPCKVVCASKHIPVVASKTGDEVLIDHKLAEKRDNATDNVEIGRET